MGFCSHVLEIYCFTRDETFDFLIQWSRTWHELETYKMVASPCSATVSSQCDVMDNSQVEIQFLVCG